MENLTYKKLSKFNYSDWIELLTKLMDWGLYDIPPGSPIITLRWSVNLNKGLMPFYLLGLMCYFDNFSLGAWLYFTLHGAYGVWWVIKDLVFPDPNFLRKTTVMSAVVLYVLMLLPYMLPGFLLISR